MLSRLLSALPERSVTDGGMVPFLNRVLTPFVRQLGNALTNFAGELEDGHLDMGQERADGTHAALRTGVGPPPNSLGNLGDLYWDEATTLAGTLYVKHLAGSPPAPVWTLLV